MRRNSNPLRATSLALFLFLGLITGCGKKKDREVCDMVCEALEFTIEAPSDGSLPAEATSFRTNLSLVNFDLLEREKVLAAALLIEKIIATEEFRDRIFEHTVGGKKTFSNNNGLTNKQIYDRILLGAETLFPVKNNAMDVELELIYEDSTTVGYTYPSSTRIWMNRKYFERYTTREVAANLMHEWLHKLGFDHAHSPTPERSTSVPYAVGYLIRNLALELENP